ncbi:hypothetical protein [Brevibacillus centrosporus]|uniref:hypothetical protein n=1 Tax=Brevibacillus centrosporus TaxID=54910 RepID=UPI002E212C62|nr:hypothetical protein [Brevibacillus centrosporus]
MKLSDDEKLSIKIKLLEVKYTNLKQITDKFVQDAKTLEAEFITAKLELKILKKLDKLVSIEDEEIDNARIKLRDIIERSLQHIKSVPSRAFAEKAVIKQLIDKYQTEKTE